MKDYIKNWLLNMKGNKMKILYVAGPYMGKTIRETVDNTRKAEELAIKIWEAGYIALCPHKNTALLDGIVSEKIFLNGSMHLLSRCDGMVVMNSSSESEDTKAEIIFALDHNIFIMGEDEF